MSYLALMSNMTLIGFLKKPEGDPELRSGWYALEVFLGFLQSPWGKGLSFVAALTLCLTQYVFVRTSGREAAIVWGSIAVTNAQLLLNLSNPPPGSDPAATTRGGGSGAAPGTELRRGETAEVLDFLAERRAQAGQSTNRSDLREEIAEKQAR